MNFPMTAEGFVGHLRTFLTEVATSVDRTRPGNFEGLAVQLCISSITLGIDRVE